MSRRRIAAGITLTLSVALVCAVLWGCDRGSEPEARTQAKDGSGEAASPSKAEKEALPEAQALIDQHIEAAGGEQAANSVQSLYLKSTYTLDKQNIEGTAEVWWKEGKFFATEEVTGFGTASSGYDGTVVWSNDPSHGLRQLEGKEAEQWIAGGAVFILPHWERYFERAETVAERDGVYDVAFTSALGQVTTYSFDKQTHLASSMSFKQILPEATIPVVVTLDDYRSIGTGAKIGGGGGEAGGYKLPFKEVTDLSMATMTKVYETIEVGAEVDESRFTMPGADGAVPAKPDEP